MTKIPNLFPPFYRGKGGFFGNSNLDIVCYLLIGAWTFLDHESNCTYISITILLLYFWDINYVSSNSCLRSLVINR